MKVRLIPLALLLSAAAAAAPPDFEKEIQPIFAANCLKCYGPEKQKGGYRLDVKSIALNGGESSAPNILPGRAAASPLVKYISSADPEERMPPSRPGISRKSRRGLMPAPPGPSGRVSRWRSAQLVVAAADR